MSWGLGWKRSTEVFHLTLSYGHDADTLDDVSPTSSISSSMSSLFSGSSPTSQDPATAANAKTNQDQLGFRIDLDWNAADGEDQVALKLQSQVMVALPTPQDAVEIELTESTEGDLENKAVGLEMRVVKRREALKGVIMWKAAGSGQQNDGGMGVLVKLMRLNFANEVADGVAVGSCCADHWLNVSVVSLSGLGLTALPVEITRLPLLEKLYLDNNKLSVLPPELVELRQSAGLVELSLEHNKLIRPILDFRAMSELRFKTFWKPS